MDDVQELAQQFVESPVMEELNRIWRRASNRVKEKLGEPQEHQFSRRSNIQDDAIVSLAKNASIYIKTFKKALGNLK
ncbi:unnamed protein product [Leptosia nina]|uniref:Uncharacterized protein n=1 Tax=Leptosia nina TaxID=320188 RepID=A0AAV1J1E2_9NEOP